MALNSITFHLKCASSDCSPTSSPGWIAEKNPVHRVPQPPEYASPRLYRRPPGEFDIFLYHPTTNNNTLDSTPNSTQKAQANYPLVIVLHGGGWCVGDARHDERFIETLTARGAVVAAVNYRLAPEHPYPVPVADCLDALLYLWKNSKDIGVDKDRTFIAGFSVGGQMAFGSLFLLWNALQEKDPRIDAATFGTVKGITAFYPPMDATKSRAERAASNPAFVALKKKPASSSKTILEIFDRAYFWNLPEPEMLYKTHMCISPGLAPEEIVKAALPTRMFVKPAGLDPLLAEGVAAAARFRDLTILCLSTQWVLIVNIRVFKLGTENSGTHL